PVRAVGLVVDLAQEHRQARGQDDDVRALPGGAAADGSVLLGGGDGVAQLAARPAGAAAVAVDEDHALRGLRLGVLRRRRAGARGQQGGREEGRPPEGDLAWSAARDRQRRASGASGVVGVGLHRPPVAGPGPTSRGGLVTWRREPRGVGQGSLEGRGGSRLRGGRRRGARWWAVPAGTPRADPTPPSTPRSGPSSPATPRAVSSPPNTPRAGDAARC